MFPTYLVCVINQVVQVPAAKSSLGYNFHAILVTCTLQKKALQVTRTLYAPKIVLVAMHHTILLLHIITRPDVACILVASACTCTSNI